jgi:hypothetical protein
MPATPSALEQFSPPGERRERGAQQRDRVQLAGPVDPGAHRALTGFVLSGGALRRLDVDSLLPDCDPEVLVIGNTTLRGKGSGIEARRQYKALGAHA